APTAPATNTTSTAPSSRPVPKNRTTGSSRQTDPLSRNAELWLQVLPELANPAAAPATSRSITPPAAATPTRAATTRTTAAVIGCRNQRTVTDSPTQDRDGALGDRQLAGPDRDSGVGLAAGEHDVGDRVGTAV